MNLSWMNRIFTRRLALTQTLRGNLEMAYYNNFYFNGDDQFETKMGKFLLKPDVYLSNIACSASLP